jgi:hypothetical protein
MKIIISVIFFLSCFCVSFAGTLVVGGAEMDGHSNKAGECINPGYSLDVGYELELLKYYPFQYLGVSLDGGGLFTYSNYETAHRDYVGGKETRQERESSATISAIIKPKIHLWKLYYYRMWGAGPDYAQTDGMDYGWLEGKGIGFDITDKISIEVSKRKFTRHDTGNSKHKTIALKFRF